MKVRFPGDRLVIATHNRGKLEEMADLLRPYPITLVSAADLGLPEPAETEDSFVGNARLKAHAAARASGLAALSDDSGLCVDALDGAPGVYTADWAETDHGRDFPVAMQKVRSELDAARAVPPWRAQFRCTLVLAWPDGRDQVFEGAMEGQLVWPVRGAQGHGFDPMFQPDGHAITCGEMDRWQKNRISHRGIAFARFVEECFT